MSKQTEEGRLRQGANDTPPPSHFSFASLPPSLISSLSLPVPIFFPSTTLCAGVWFPYLQEAFTAQNSWWDEAHTYALPRQWNFTAVYPWALPRVRELMFLYPEETSSCCSGPAGYSGVHFSTAGPHGAIIWLCPKAVIWTQTSRNSDFFSDLTRDASHCTQNLVQAKQAIHPQFALRYVASLLKAWQPRVLSMASDITEGPEMPLHLHSYGRALCNWSKKTLATTLPHGLSEQWVLIYLHFSVLVVLLLEVQNYCVLGSPQSASSESKPLNLPSSTSWMIKQNYPVSWNSASLPNHCSISCRQSITNIYILLFNPKNCK